MMLTLCIALNSCSSDEPEPTGSTSSGTASSVAVILSDGTTSTGVTFYPIDDTSFILDNIVYTIERKHLKITGYNPDGISECVKPYALVFYKGIKYETRVVGGGAFFNCSEMKSCDLPPTIIRIEDLAQIGDTDRRVGAFEDCSNLQSIYFPNRLEYIGASSFRGCSKLESIKLPDHLVEIGNYAFCGCKTLKAVTFSENIKTLGNYVFNDCIRLSSVALPESLTEIGCDAFNGCSGLTSVKLPRSITHLWNGTFSGCTNLSNISCEALIPPSAYELTFDQTTFKNATLNIPKSSIASYEKQFPWNKFKNIKGI